MAKSTTLLRHRRPGTFDVRAPGLPLAVTAQMAGADPRSVGEWEDTRRDATKTDIVGSPFQLVGNGSTAAGAQDPVVCREVGYTALPHVKLAVLDDASGARRLVSVQRLQRESGRDQRSTPGFSPDGLLGCHVRHPNVFAVLDVIDVRGELLLVMEYVASETLGRLEANGNRLPVPISVAIARGVLQALSAAHDARCASGEALEIIHANIDPDNILVGADGVPRLVHFGRAAKEGSACPTPAAKGKSRYIAPEQVFDKEVDVRTDVFQIGVVLWESLTGRSLIAGGSAVDCMLRFISNGSHAPSEANPEVNEALDAVLLRALEPSPERRFQSAADFAEALGAAVSPAPRAAVAGYVEAVAGTAIQEQRAFLGDVPLEETPTTCVRLASMFREVPAPRPLEPTIVDEADEPTAALGQFLDHGLLDELASHWSSRDADELTAVDGAPERKPAKSANFEVAAPLARQHVFGTPVQHNPVPPAASKPVARAATGSEPEIVYSSNSTSPDDALDLADAVSDFDGESWVHPAPSPTIPAGRAPSDPASLPSAGFARRTAPRLVRGLTWSLAFALVFASTFFLTKTLHDAGYRARTGATLHAIATRALSAVTTPKTKPAAPRAEPAPSAPSVVPPEALPPPSLAAEEERGAPSTSPPAPRILSLEELPLAPEAQTKKVRPKKNLRTRRAAARPPADTSASSPDTVVTLPDE